jgi:Protein of unknown function (DUF1761)
MILEYVDDINWLAVIASVAAAFLVGLVWFSPPVFGGYWARQVSRYTAIPERTITRDASRTSALARWLGSIVVTAVVMATAVEAVGADSAAEGVALGVVLVLGFGATFASWPSIFARMPWEWWLVNTSAFLLMQVAMGVILTAWP